MKRLITVVAIITLLLNVSITAVYAEPESEAPAQKQVIFYLKPDITVELNGVRLVFKDANGQTTYPIIYNGTTYLPVRAASALMKEPIEWNTNLKTVFIGKTLFHPVKSEASIPTDSAIEADENDIAMAESLKSSLEMGYLKPDISVMYDFVIQNFKDANGITVYPLNYNGSNYLPVRAISGLMNEPIEWDGAAKLISIGDGDQPDEDVYQIDDDTVMKQLVDIYESEEALYYEVSAKISSIGDATSEQKQAIAASSSDNLVQAQELTGDVKDIDPEDFTDEEQSAYEKLLDFAESNETYLLLLENIAYLAASDADYSMLEESFLYAAIDAQTKMEEARMLITPKD